MPDRAKQIAKFIGVPLEKGFTHSEEGHLIARGFFTSDKEDVMGDIITKKATEGAVDAYRQWGNIRYMHQPRPVGKVIGIGKADGLKWNEVEFKIVDKQAAYEVEQELLTALSVGILINWNDIEITEEGGFVISAYQLAEISLVDHPANYDATLKGVEATEGLRYLAQEYGFETVARGMASLLNIQLEGSNMSKKVKGTVEGENVEEEEVTSEAETEEVEAEVESEKDLSSEEGSEEEGSEENAETEEVEGSEESQEEVSVEASITEAFTSGFAKLFEVLESQNAKLDLLLASLETSAEDHGSDQSESEGEEQESEEVDLGLEGDESEEESAPVDRDGQIQATDSDLSDGGDEETPEYSKDLEGALFKFFGVEQDV